MRHKCLENFEDFNKDLSDECYTKRGKNVTLPECGMTSFIYLLPLCLLSLIAIFYLFLYTLIVYSPNFSYADHILQKSRKLEIL